MTSAEEVTDALAYTTASARMFEDPNLTGNVLLLGQALLHELFQQRTTGRSRPRGTPGDTLRPRHVWLDAALLIHPEKPDDAAWIWLRMTLADDAPRYEMPRYPFDAVKCDAPMIRRDGRCGQSTSAGYALPNPFTGERVMAGHCRRHAAWGNQRHREAWDNFKAAGSPVPHNNRGGHLMPYFDTDWDGMYRWASYRYTPDQGVPERQPPRARLALVTPLRRGEDE